MTGSALACHGLPRGRDGGEKGEEDEVSGNSTVAAAARTEATPRCAGWLGFCAFAATIALLAAQALIARRLELTFDEAYYTLWSRALSFGYLDHPPMVALFIRASTALFGGSEIGVRALSLLVVGAMPALIALIAWRLFGSAEKAALAALMWVAMPLILVGAVFVTPDAPLVVFWTLGLAALVELWRTGEARWLVALGLALGLALESKFTAVFFAAGGGLALAAAPSLRRWLASPALFAGLAVALAIFAPFVAWNAAHGWATFAKQFGRAPPHGFAPFYIAEFLVSQVGLINPLVFAALVPAVATIPWRAPVSPRSRDEARRVLACTIAPAAVYFLLHSTHARVQGNWLAPLYPAAAILAADWVAEVRRAGASGLSALIAKAARVCGARVRRDLDRRRTARARRSAGAARGLSRAGPRSRLQGPRRQRRLRPDPGLRADLAHVLLRRSGNRGRAARATDALDLRARAAGDAVCRARPRLGRARPPV